MKTIKSVILISAMLFSMSYLYSCGTKEMVGPQGEQGIQGEPGKDGHSPEITIGENGNWYIDGVDTNLSAKGEEGQQGIPGNDGLNGIDGQDGTSLLTGNGTPSIELGKNGDSYIDLDSWNYYIKVNNIWENKGNIKGESGEHDGTDGLEFYLLEDGTYGVAMGTTKYLKNIVIPSTYKDKPVTQVIDSAFQDSIVESIFIPNSVTSIGHSAFWCCKSLTSIEIPTSVTSIGPSAFGFCCSLTSITIPNNDISIGAFAFSNCNSLTTIEIPNSVISIGEEVFSGCSSLENVYYNGIIEDWCNIKLDNPILYADHFYMKDSNNEYYEVTEIEIPNTIKSIGHYQFNGFINLTKVTIPSSVTSIGSNLFYSYKTIENVYYNGTIEDWCNIEFSSYDSNPIYYADHFYMKDFNDEYYEVTEIEIPNTIKSIGNYQFNGFTNLTKVTISDSVTSIGFSAFYGCSSLEYIVIPDSVTSIGGYAFYGCSSLMNILILEGVTSIGDYTFFGCSSLTIYCEATAKPSGWSNLWIGDYWPGDYWPVYWGVTIVK